MLPVNAGGRQNDLASLPESLFESVIISWHHLPFKQRLNRTRTMHHRGVVEKTEKSYCRNVYKLLFFLVLFPSSS